MRLVDITGNSLEMVLCIGFELFITRSIYLITSCANTLILRHRAMSAKCGDVQIHEQF
jgi:hypothetical protein